MKSSENIKKQIRYVQRIEILLVFSAVLANCGKPASNETIINSKGSAQTLNCDNNDCDPAVDPKIQAGIRAEGSAIVESCSQKLDSGKTYEIESHGEHPGGSLRIRTKADGLHVGINVRFWTLAATVSDARAEEMFRGYQSCVPQIQEVWNRYGIKFDLNLDLQQKPSNLIPDVWIQIIDEPGRDFVNVYRYWPNHNDRCLTMMHELGHLLMLPDEYPESNYPDRVVAKESNPWSVMDAYYKGWNRVEFFPRHISTLLHPVCGASATAQPKVPERIKLTAVTPVEMDDGTIFQNGVKADGTGWTRGAEECMLKRKGVRMPGNPTTLSAHSKIEMFLYHPRTSSLVVYGTASSDLTMMCKVNTTISLEQIRSILGTNYFKIETVK
ncbi:MAG: hypothetical protein A2583_12740 [Bdellovibrionales bacterium RIFOXYD1_FULL_53_11]|nr:MAG: hypothetical protein A2583_12740 [Bdellovibrionales bacterium RIFOXYD1_FULL_53_11]